MLTELRKNIKLDFKGKRGSIKGQIFPFLVLVMVIMIVAVMAFVNVAQVNTRKLATMNAADAGVLAGAAQLASTANKIAGVNKEALLEPFIKWQQYTPSAPYDPWAATARQSIYMSTAISNLITYLNLLAGGIAGVQQSAAQAVTTAFGNMPIEEAQTRIGSVTGDQKALSRFTKWIHGINFYSEDTEQEYTYKWTSHYYNITEQRGMPSNQEDFVKVKVEKPKDNSFALIPSSPLPQVTMYYVYLPCEYYGEAGPFCTPVREATVTRANEDVIDRFPEIAFWTISIAYFAAAIHALLAKMPTPVVSKLLIDCYMSIRFLRYLLRPYKFFNQCCAGALTMVLYWVPLPFIQYIQDDNPEIGVEVTRFSPTRDLGLWQFKQRSITSGARARIHGGDAFKADYKVEVTRVWDGEKL